MSLHGDPVLIKIYMQLGEMHSVARWLSWLKRLTSNEEIPSSNLGRAFLHFIIIYFS